MRSKMTIGFIAGLLITICLPLLWPGSATNKMQITPLSGFTANTTNLYGLAISTPATWTACILQGAAGQAAPYLDARDSAGVSKISISSNGVLNMGGVIAGTVAGDIYNDTGRAKHATYSNGLPGWIERCIWSGYNRVCHYGVATGLSMLTPAAIGTRVLPANFWTHGKTLRIRLQGDMSTDAAPGTGNITVKFSDITFRTTGDFNLDPNLSLGFWTMDFAIVCSTTGSTGSIDGVLGFVHAETTGANQPVFNEPFTPAGTVSLNTTSAYTFDVIWSASDTATSHCTTTARIWEVM